MNIRKGRTAAYVIAMFALACCVNYRSYAQATEQLAASTNALSAGGLYSAAATSEAARRIVPLRLSEAPDGSRVTVASDARLDGYTSGSSGESFYVLIPRAEAPAAQAPLAGRGLKEARVEQRGPDVLLSFRLEPGATVRVAEGFNRLEVIFKAAPAASDDSADAIRQMRAQIDQLEARIRDLEARQGQGSAVAGSQQQTAAPQAVPANAPVATEARAEVESHPGMSHDEEETKGTPRLQIQGFADVNFSASNLKGRTAGFALGQLDLFITSRLSDKLSVLSELILEAGQDNQFSFEIHRLLLRYAPNDYFNLSVGRYHSSIGFYNTAYHHGSWFQTTANRPFIFAFEGRGGILPLHNVGLSATGRVPNAPLGIRYVAEIGNGRASRSALDRAVQTSGDENNGKAFNLGLFSRPKLLPGFQTGVSVYRDYLTPQGQPKIGQTILAGHVVYQSRLYEFLNEAVVLRHARGGTVFNTPAFYTQFSRRFGNARPYFRYQYINVPGDDPVYSNVGRRNGPTLGLRYDVSDFAAFKAQYERTNRRSLSTVDELILQLAFTF